MDTVSQDNIEVRDPPWDGRMRLVFDALASMIDQSADHLQHVISLVNAMDLDDNVDYNATLGGALDIAESQFCGDEGEEIEQHVFRLVSS